MPPKAVLAIFSRYGKPLAVPMPPVAADDQRALLALPGGGEASVRVLQVRGYGDVIPNDYFVLERGGEDALAVGGRCSRPRSRRSRARRALGSGPPRSRLRAGGRRGVVPAVSEAELPDFVSILTERIWYLTQSGRDMWCRPPHGFFFTSSEAAIAFATAIGTELELAPIAIASKELVSAEGIAAMRDLDVTRIFVDPRSTPKPGTSSAPSCASPRPRPSSNPGFTG